MYVYVCMCHIQIGLSQQVGVENWLGGGGENFLHTTCVRIPVKEEKFFSHATNWSKRHQS